MRCGIDAYLFDPVVFVRNIGKRENIADDAPLSHRKLTCGIYLLAAGCGVIEVPWRSRVAR